MIASRDIHRHPALCAPMAARMAATRNVFQVAPLTVDVGALIGIEHEITKERSLK